MFSSLVKPVVASTAEIQKVAQSFLAGARFGLLFHLDFDAGDGQRDPAAAHRRRRTNAGESSEENYLDGVDSRSRDWP